MRLLFLSNYYPPYHTGGYEELCAEVASGLRCRGHSVAVLTTNRGVNGTPQSENGVYRVLYSRVDTRPYRAAVDFFTKDGQHSKHNLDYMRRAVEDLKPDVLMVWGMWNLNSEILVQAEQWRQPTTVYYLADYWPTLPDAYVQYWQAPARSRFTALAKKTLATVSLNALSAQVQGAPLKFEHAACVSAAVRDTLVKAGMPLERARIIYNGIDTRAFCQHTRNRDQRRKSSPLSLLYAGRLAPEKGVHTAIAATGILAKKDCRVSLTVIGSGRREYEQQLEHAAALAGAAQVTFRGRVPREEMPGILAEHDVLLVPSTWQDPLPRIIQEGMAAGLAVVGANVGGIPEIITGGVNGLTFAPGNEGELADQIERLSLDRPLLARLASAGVETARTRFDISRMLDELESYLQEVMQAS